MIVFSNNMFISYYFIIDINALSSRQKLVLTF